MSDEGAPFERVIGSFPPPADAAVDLSQGAQALPAMPASSRFSKGGTASRVARAVIAVMESTARRDNGSSAAEARSAAWPGRPLAAPPFAGGIEPGVGVAHYATEMIVHTRPDRVRTYVSPGSRNLLGYAPHEILGLDFATFLHPDDRARVESEYATFQQNGGRTTSTYRLRHRDGTYVWVESNWVAVPVDAAGVEAGVVAVVRDVTDRKRAEEALQAALLRAERAEAEAARLHSRLTDAIEAIPAGFVLFDAEERLVMCNGRYREIYPALADVMTPCATLGELTRLGVERGQFDTGEQEAADWVADQLARQRQSLAKYERKLPDGRWIALEDRRTAEGGLVGIRVDITDLKRREVELAEMRDAAERANVELAALACTDGLTGLASRRRLDETLAREWGRAERTGESICVLLLDVDYFKAFNDHYGHLAGDDTLRAVARAVQAGARRSTDLASRFGGEEFALVLPDTDLPAAEEIAETIRHEVVLLRIPHMKSPLAVLTASVGIAASVPTPGITPATLLAAADSALYAAKKAGRNSVRVAADVACPGKARAPDGGEAA